MASVASPCAKNILPFGCVEMARPLAAVAKKVAGSNRRAPALGPPSVSIFAMQHFSPIAVANLCKIAHFVRNDRGRPTVAAAYTIRTAEPEHSALDHAGFAKLSVCLSVESVPGRAHYEEAWTSRGPRGRGRPCRTGRWVSLRSDFDTSEAVRWRGTRDP
jgi:hypothetical protein